MFQSLLLAALIFFPICNSTDTISRIKPLRDGETIISAGQNFVLGFFSPGNSKNRYVGIWYNKTSDQTVVWTANRENQVGNSSGVLTIIGGNLVLIDGGHNNNNIILWSTDVSSSTMANYSSATHRFWRATAPFKEGSDSIWRTGPWNGERLGGVPLTNRSTTADSWSYVANDDEIYLTYKGTNSSITSMSFLEHSGLLQRLMWNDNNRRWNQI
ncbi:hypothetical protein MRB53_021451 [Persea americana]|uniref:Uncharacterized protein n=1 Tax=Persea americana TaxID=3435 RepID=A0ACC2L3Y8_PERAE|nr:hypothetical protein MRB53_021451 [Persea americana]